MALHFVISLAPLVAGILLYVLPTPVTLPCGSLRVVTLDQRSAKQKRSLHVQQGVMTGEHDICICIYHISSSFQSS